MTLRKRALSFVPLVLLFALAMSVAVDDRLVVADDDGPCGRPPEAKPHRRKGGESFPPLPLPATPLRRTEKKKPPEPPALVGKIVWGATHEYLTAQGKLYTWGDWSNDPNDLQKLLKNARNALKIAYNNKAVKLSDFSGDPSEIPILFLTGGRAPQFSRDEKIKLRDYVLAGGTLWAECDKSSAEFYKWFKETMAELFPDRALRKLGADHPLFSCYYGIRSVVLSEQGKNKAPAAPHVEGVDIGCRTAVILSRHDVSCGWDNHVPHDGACGLTAQDATKLGINMINYSLAYHNLGVFHATKKEYAPAVKDGSGEFVFARLKHSGNWNPHPSGAYEFSASLNAMTSISVSFKVADIDLDTLASAPTPFLYVTGHGPFVLSERERALLTRHIGAGGVLFADACCGDREFHESFLREAAQFLPGAQFKKLGAEHPVYSCLHKIEGVRYSPATGGMDPFPLFGVSIEGATRVFYSPVGLATAWDGAERPYGKYVYKPDAVKLGVNLIVYSMTH